MQQHHQNQTGCAAVKKLDLLLISPTYKLVEFLIIFVVVPTLIIAEKLAPYMFAFLWVGLIYCGFVYVRVHSTARTRLWRLKAVRWKHLRPMLSRFLLCTFLTYIFISLYDPARTFDLLENRPELWTRVMFFYPIFSAIPQEFIFCSFFFARYKSLFHSRRRMIWASAIVFAYAHVLFINWVAPFLSLVAGYFFAATYAKRRSLALVSLEHALYGNMMFTMGLGWYFWGGSVR